MQVETKQTCEKMATLKEKSETNLGSALALTKSEETCLSSVHCSYYSCYQLILYYLDKEFAYDENKRKAEYDQYVRTLNGGKRLGSHEYWIKEFMNRISKSGHAGNSFLINSNIRSLKEARVEADYQEIDFTKKQTDTIYDKARDTIKLINKSFCL